MDKHFDMTASGALYWLRKLGYNYKKKTSPMWKQTKIKNNIKPENLVYIDESGIYMTICQDRG
jgi:hypothetical protein